MQKRYKASRQRILKSCALKRIIASVDRWKKMQTLFFFQSEQHKSILDRTKTVLQECGQSQVIVYTNTNEAGYYDDIAWMFFRALFWLRSPWSWKWYTYNNNEISFGFGLCLCVLLLAFFHLNCQDFGYVVVPLFSVELKLCYTNVPQSKITQSKTTTTKKRETANLRTHKNSKMDTPNE